MPEWDGYRLDTPMGGDPLQPLEDQGTYLVDYENVYEVDCPMHAHGIFSRFFIWGGNPPCYCGKLPKAVLVSMKTPPNQIFRGLWHRWFGKRALEGEKTITYDHERDDGYCIPDPNCQCIACSCTCAACMARKQPP